MAGALGLIWSLPELSPRLARARGILVPAAIIIAVCFTMDRWVGSTLNLHRIPLQLASHFPISAHPWFRGIPASLGLKGAVCCFPLFLLLASFAGGLAGPEGFGYSGPLLKRIGLPPARLQPGSGP